MLCLFYSIFILFLAIHWLESKPGKRCKSISRKLFEEPVFEFVGELFLETGTIVQLSLLWSVILFVLVILFALHKLFYSGIISVVTAVRQERTFRLRWTMNISAESIWLKGNAIDFKSLCNSWVKHSSVRTCTYSEFSPKWSTHSNTANKGESEFKSLLDARTWAKILQVSIARFYMPLTSHIQGTTYSVFGFMKAWQMHLQNYPGAPEYHIILKWVFSPIKIELGRIGLGLWFKARWSITRWLKNIQIFWAKYLVSHLPTLRRDVQYHFHLYTFIGSVPMGSIFFLLP